MEVDPVTPEAASPNETGPPLPVTPKPPPEVAPGERRISCGPPPEEGLVPPPEEVIFAPPEEEGFYGSQYSTDGIRSLKSTVVILISTPFGLSRVANLFVVYWLPQPISKISKLEMS